VAENRIGFTCAAMITDEKCTVEAAIGTVDHRKRLSIPEDHAHVRRHFV
jgi:hypothetical protein